MQALIRHMRERPALFALAGTVGATISAAAYFAAFKANNDPHLVYNSREDPFPYLRIRNNNSGKFFKVNQNVEEDFSEHYDLLDILNGKYGDN